MQRISRRALLGSRAATALAACAPQEGGSRQAAIAAAGDDPPVTQRAVTPSVASDGIARPAPTPTPLPVPPAGASERVLLPGTPSETRVVIRHSGVRGPAAVVLGGVHGNEPGAWLAADTVAGWEPAAGSLVVTPRANVQAIAGFVRTTDEIGDLNRFYPGNAESAFLMERMAAEILALAREFGAELLLDMHESWAFYREYPGTGTGALGQTVTIGAGPRGREYGQAILDAVNPGFSERERMLIRDGSPFGRSDPPPAGQPNRGRSSLAAGGFVTGLTPILVEMGQEHQEIERRVELHLATARAVLSLAGVV